MTCTEAREIFGAPPEAFHPLVRVAVHCHYRDCLDCQEWLAKAIEHAPSPNDELCEQLIKEMREAIA